MTKLYRLDCVFAEGADKPVPWYNTIPATAYDVAMDKAVDLAKNVVKFKRRASLTFDPQALKVDVYEKDDYLDAQVEVEFLDLSVIVYLREVQ